MRGKTLAGAACLALAVAGVGAALAGAIDVVSLVGAVPVSIMGVVLLVLGSVDAGLERDGARVRELAERGTRHVGRVIDALQYASPSGGAVFQAGGAQMVLSVELPLVNGGMRQVVVHVVEPSETARARIGTSVTILEHPLDPALRALQGFLPNGRRA